MPYRFRNIFSLYDVTQGWTTTPWVTDYDDL